MVRMSETREKQITFAAKDYGRHTSQNEDLATQAATNESQQDEPYPQDTLLGILAKVK